MSLGDMTTDEQIVYFEAHGYDPEGARERRAALLAAGKLRTALGQLDGEETGVRCRIAADERKAFSLIAATMKTRGGAVGRSSSVATGGGAAPR